MCNYGQSINLILAYNCDFLAGIFYFIESGIYPDLIEKLNLKLAKKIESNNFKNCVLLSITRSKKNCVVVKNENYYFADYIKLSHLEFKSKSSNKALKSSSDSVPIVLNSI